MTDDGYLHRLIFGELPDPPRNHTPTGRPRGRPLSPEKAALIKAYMAKGTSVQAIARRLCISERTVERHR